MWQTTASVANLLLQEDAHAIELDLQSNGKPKASMFGVFDGHGGKEVARFTAMHIVSCALGPVHRHRRCVSAAVAATLPPVPSTSSMQARGLVM